MSIMSGNSTNAICSASEMPSPTFLSTNYDKEFEDADKIGENPFMGFEKDFLRFMLSDGSGAVLLSNTPKDLSFRIDWIEMTSYAHKLPTCMYCGAEIRDDGELKGWREFSNEERISQSIFVLKQNIRLLKTHVIRYWADHVQDCLKEHDVDTNGIKYIVPHVSSMFIWKELAKEFKLRPINLGEEKWFTNLPQVGNIGSASIFVALEELYRTKDLKSGDKILLLVPESGRFSYGTVHLTVV